MAQEVSTTGIEKAGALPDLHVCNNYRHVLMALATITHGGRPATVVYLEDVLPMPATLRARLAVACPLARFVFTRDADQIDAFAKLPKALPAIVRRNLTFGGRFGVVTPHHWEMPLLAGQRFGTGYVYHAGFFTAKAFAGRCGRVVLREDGLNNYDLLTVPPLKAVLRALSGFSPRKQVWGEERWIDRIEVSHPANLPASVQHKARALTFSDVMDVLPAPVARRIATAFCPDLPPTTQPDVQSAILLTQPIDEIGICTFAKKRALYGDIAARLQAAGYQVSVKPHPRETTIDLPGVANISPDFPVEALPYLTEHKFSLAVALYSAALVGGARAFALRTAQLLPQALFNADGFDGWPEAINLALAQALKARTPD